MNIIDVAFAITSLAFMAAMLWFVVALYGQNKRQQKKALVASIIAALGVLVVVAWKLKGWV